MPEPLRDLLLRLHATREAAQRLQREATEAYAHVRTLEADLVHLAGGKTFVLSSGEALCVFSVSPDTGTPSVVIHEAERVDAEPGMLVRASDPHEARTDRKAVEPAPKAEDLTRLGPAIADAAAKRNKAKDVGLCKGCGRAAHPNVPCEEAAGLREEPLPVKAPALPDQTAMRGKLAEIAKRVSITFARELLQRVAGADRLGAVPADKLAAVDVALDEALNAKTSKGAA